MGGKNHFLMPTRFIVDLDFRMKSGGACLRGQIMVCTDTSHKFPRTLNST